MHGEIRAYTVDLDERRDVSLHRHTRCYKDAKCDHRGDFERRVVPWSRLSSHLRMRFSILLYEVGTWPITRLRHRIRVFCGMGVRYGVQGRIVSMPYKSSELTACRDTRIIQSGCTILGLYFIQGTQDRRA